VRTIGLRGGQLTLNGQLLHLRGVNLHEQDQSQGAALDPAHLDQLFAWAKELGAGIIRAHYPLNPEIEELADREGVLLWSEIPVYQVASSYLGQPAWRAGAEAVLTNDIRTNQNHPSVLVWSIGNELPSPATGAEAGYISAATALAHRLDPTRPVGLAVSAWPGLNCQPAWAPLDVVGDNDYFGWYDAGGGTTDDRDALSAYLDTLRACDPAQALMVTEFGFEANRTGPVEERGTYAFQSDAAAFHLGVFASKPWLSGAMYFALQDFAVTPGWTGGNPLADPPFLHKGLLDLSGHEKPAFSVVSQIFHTTRQVGG
jgi:beta-glucuronidase